MRVVSSFSPELYKICILVLAEALRALKGKFKLWSRFPVSFLTWRSSCNIQQNHPNQSGSLWFVWNEQIHSLQIDENKLFNLQQTDEWMKLRAPVQFQGHQYYMSLTTPAVPEGDIKLITTENIQEAKINKISQWQDACDFVWKISLWCISRSRVTKVNSASLESKSGSSTWGRNKRLLSEAPHKRGKRPRLIVDLAAEILILKLESGRSSEGDKTAAEARLWDVQSHVGRWNQWWLGLEQLRRFKSTAETHHCVFSWSWLHLSNPLTLC